MKDSKFFQGKYGYILAPVACLFANPFFREKLSHYQNYELFLTLNEVISNRRIDEVIIFISKLGGDLFNRKKKLFQQFVSYLRIRKNIVLPEYYDASNFLSNILIPVIQEIVPSIFEDFSFEIRVEKVHLKFL